MSNEQQNSLGSAYNKGYNDGYNKGRSDQVAFFEPKLEQALSNYHQREVQLKKALAEIEVWRDKFNAMAVQEQTSRVEANRLRGELRQLKETK